MTFEQEFCEKHGIAITPTQFNKQHQTDVKNTEDLLKAYLKAKVESITNKLEKKDCGDNQACHGYNEALIDIQYELLK